MKLRTVWMFGLSAVLLVGCFKDNMHDNQNGNGNQQGYRLRANIGLEMASVAGFTLVNAGRQLHETLRVVGDRGHFARGAGRSD